jgi:hypothetical protein
MNDSAMLQRKTNPIAAGIPLKTAKNQSGTNIFLQCRHLQRMACGFIESKMNLVKRPPGRPQAGRKSPSEEDGKRREEEIWTEGGEEDGAGRRQQFQTGVFTPFSARPCQIVPSRNPDPLGQAV